MNDIPVSESKATKADMTACTKHGMRVFERIESGFDELYGVWGQALKLGMITKNEHDHLLNDSEALKHHVLSLHCRGTAIAQRNGCDIVQTLGGPGR